VHYWMYYRIPLKVQEEYSAMREQYMRSGEGFVLVFAINYLGQVLKRIQTFYQQILRVKDTDFIPPMTLVGNKCDMENEQEISTTEGKDLARKMNAKFVETSARYRVNVDEAYYSLVRSIRDENRKGGKQGSKNNLRDNTAKKKKIRCLIQ